MKSNGEPEYVLIEDMAPDHIARAISKAKLDNNSLIIDILANEIDRRSKRGENALSKLNNNNNNTTKQKTMSTNRNSSAVAKSSDVLNSNEENNQNDFKYDLNQVVRLAGKDHKVRDVIVTFRQEAVTENGYRAAYRYKVKGSNGDNSALYSQREMIEMENRAVTLEKRRSKKKAAKEKKPRDISQKFEENKTYGRYTIVKHSAILRYGKRKDGTLAISNSIVGHRYDVTIDGGKTVVTFTQTELLRAIEREANAVEANTVIQSELDFNSQENSQLRAENTELKRMIAEIHEKLNSRSANNTTV